jgi:DNA-binding HxlR family transcriptional regulator
VDWQQLFDISDIRILFYLQDCAGHEARYSELLRNAVKTRSVLADSLRDLTKRKMVERIVEPAAPIQTKYKLTEKGVRVLQLLTNLQKLVL